MSLSPGRRSVRTAAKGPNHRIEIRAKLVPILAEGVGFEPTMRLPHNGFQVVRPT